MAAMRCMAPAACHKLPPALHPPLRPGGGSLHWLSCGVSSLLCARQLTFSRRSWANSARRSSRKVLSKAVATAADGSPQHPVVVIDWCSWRAGGQQLTPESFQQTPLAEYWKDLPNQPLASDDFLGRQAIFAKMMALEPIAQLFGPSKIDGLPTRHWFWGYCALLDWERRTGRLGKTKETTISPDSWWGAINYSLCVLPLAAAMDAGLVSKNEVKTVDFSEADRIEFAVARAEWAQFWRNLESRAKVGKPLTEEEHDNLLEHEWECHTCSAAAAIAIYEPLLQPFPLDERRFSKGWATFVEMLAAIRFRTDLEFIFATGAGYLPPKLSELSQGSEILETMKVEPWEAKRMRQSAKVAQQASGMSPLTLRLVVSLWRRATRRLARRERAHVIVQGLGRPELRPQLGAMLRLLGWFCWP